MRSPARFFDALLVFTLLVVVYSFFYSGTFLIDDEHILASRALSFAFEGDFNNSRVLGNSRVFEYSIVPEQWANQAMNIEPVQAVAGGLLALLSDIFHVGHIQMMFLMNIWATAATAAIVYLSAAKMGYSRRVSFFTAAVFGLGTIAMPYTRTFFRDPLAMLFLTAAWYLMLVIKQANQQERGDTFKTVILWIVFITTFTTGVLSKNSVILALLIVLLELILNHPRREIGMRANKNFKDWLVPLFVFTGLFLCWLLIVPAIPMLTRFSPFYYFTVLQKFLSTPRTGLLQALLGPFFSPGKSIFIFSPVLLLAVWSLFTRFRAAWSAWLYLVLLVFAQALFYDGEWAGHVNWGLRFVLPAIPLLVLASAPTVEALMKKRGGTAFLIGLLVLSCLIQILGSVVPVRQYYLETLNGTPPISEFSTIWSPRTSIITWSVNWIMTGQPLDLAIVRVPSALWWLIPFSAIMPGLVLAGLSAQKRYWMVMVAFSLTFILDIGLVSIYRDDPQYSNNRADFLQSQQYIEATYQPGDLVLVKSYSEDIWNNWMNWSSPFVAWTSLPFAYPSPEQVTNATRTASPDLALDETTLWIFAHKINPGSRVWLVVDQNSPLADYNFEEQWLGTRSTSHECKTYGDDLFATRVCSFTIRN